MDIIPLIKSRKAKIGIIGLGYVGLPLAVEFAEAGFNVTGFEVDPRKADKLNKGQSYINDVPGAVLKPLVQAKKIKATTQFSHLAKQNAILICVPTPLRKTKDPDVSYIVAAMERISAYQKKDQLIILESTTYPGTTRELLLPELERKGFKVGKDFFLAFSPERVDPGNQKYGLRNTPKVVGGITPECTKRANLLYSTFAENTVPVSSTESAEMVKLLENTFRAVNIGLVNEVALMCDRLKLNVWEVIEAAGTKPFGFMPFFPGPGLGGHCIPLDPHYLSWKLKTLNFYSRFIELAGEINSSMPEHVVRKISDALNEAGKSIKGSKILILGVAYKKDVGDTRESPALDVIQLLKQKQANVSYFDPFVPSLKTAGRAVPSRPADKKNISQSDCVVVLTNHSSFKINEIVKHARLLVDTRNATRGLTSPKIVRL